MAGILERIQEHVPKKALTEFGRFYHPYDNRKIIGMNYAQVTESYGRYLDACERISRITRTQNKPEAGNGE